MAKPKFYLGQTVVALKEARGGKSYSSYCRKGEQTKVYKIEYGKDYCSYICSPEGFRFKESELCTVKEFPSIKKNWWW